MILKINNGNDRQNTVIALVNAGYKVWLEERRELLKSEYFVHYEEVNGDNTK